MRLHVILIGFVLGMGCSSEGWRISSNYDPEVAKGKYTTFGFTDASLNIPLQEEDRQKLLVAIKDQFSSRGISYSRSPDMLVNVMYLTERKDDFDRNRFNDPYGFGPYGYGRYPNSGWVDYWTEGVVVLELMNADSREIFWSAEGSRKNRTGKNAQPTDPSEAIAQMLEEFPGSGSN